MKKKKEEEEEEKKKKAFISTYSRLYFVKTTKTQPNLERIYRDIKIINSDNHCKLTNSVITEVDLFIPSTGAGPSDYYADLYMDFFLQIKQKIPSHRSKKWPYIYKIKKTGVPQH